MPSAGNETSQHIDDAAARWVARIDRGPLSADEQRLLEIWLGGDIRRRGAFAKASAIMTHASRARVLTPRQGAESATPLLSRRRFFLGGAAMAASLAALAMLVSSGFIQSVFEPRTLLQTAKGEIRRLPMPDGSGVTLNTNSSLRVVYSAERRTVDLVAGEALFDVAKDPQRPFVVRAGDTEVRAVGTSFSVRLQENGSVQVLVNEGVVELIRDGQRRPVRAVANVLATAAPRPIIDIAVPEIDTQLIEPDQVMRDLAWREGMLSFDGETLAEAAAEFARYSTTRIVIDDAQLGQLTLTGLFSASDPQGFARAAASAFNGRVRLTGDEVHISR